MKKFNRIIFIGRFQPLHNGHIDTILKAKELADEVVVLVGSSFRPRSIDNPFTFSERKQMIDSCVDNIKVYPLKDYKYDDIQWADQFKEYIIDGTAIIGHIKDKSSYYIKLISSLYNIEHIEVDGFDKLSGVDIRHAIYKGYQLNGLTKEVNDIVSNVDLVQLMAEYRYITNYVNEYKDLPFPPIFVTTGIIVRYKDEILTVKRKHDTGIGLYALPGGFLDAETDKSLFDGAMRELKEETNINFYEVDCQYVDNKIYDQLGRSKRGRMISHIFYLVFDTKPDALAGDDAMSVEWLKFNDIDSRNWYSDHYDIIYDMIPDFSKIPGK